MTLLQSSTVQYLWPFANLSLAFLCFSLMKGFFLDLQIFSPAPRSLFQTGPLLANWVPKAELYCCAPPPNIMEVKKKNTYYRGSK